jgi:hypothetical protein
MHEALGLTAGEFAGAVGSVLAVRDAGDAGAADGVDAAVGVDAIGKKCQRGRGAGEVMEAYLHGVSTRKVDDLVKALGCGHRDLEVRGLPDLRGSR